jgi:undecaprenyl-phosphate 4-deoxy-4-formamido-L-arabinose transferase
MKEISIVIPVYNSHECVAEISRQLADALKKFDYEQIMV